MIIYCLWSNYYDGCNVWETLIDIYSTKEKAEDRQLEEMIKNTDSNLDFNICPMEVK